MTFCPDKLATVLYTVHDKYVHVSLLSLSLAVGGFVPLGGFVCDCVRGD